MHICCVFCWQLLLNIVFLFLVIVKLPFLLTSGIMPLCMQFISRSTRMEKMFVVFKRTWIYTPFIWHLNLLLGILLQDSSLL